MRIKRSDDEQIVSAHDRYLYGQNNNLYYNQQSNTSCAYDAEVDFSYSDKEFMNELAKDRAYGVANIRPVSKDMNSFSQRMYKDAIEEASRVKTMGYFNQFPELKPTNPVHNSTHKRINHIKQESNNNDSNKVINFESKTDNISFTQDNINLSNKMSFSANDNISNNNNINFVNFGEQPSCPQPDNISPSISSPNNYNAMLDAVHNNIKQEIATQIVDENKAKLREQVKTDANNIPYKKTQEFIPTTDSNNNQQQQLQVRDYKKSKNSGEQSTMSFIQWLLAIPFLVMPFIGFLISSIISIISPNTKSFRIFTRFCLIIHMLVSIVAVYLYCTGKLNLEIIKSYLNL